MLRKFAVEEYQSLRFLPVGMVGFYWPDGRWQVTFTLCINSWGQAHSKQGHIEVLGGI